MQRQTCYLPPIVHGVRIVRPFRTVLELNLLLRSVNPGMSASRSSEYNTIKIATAQAIFTVAASKSEPIHPNHLPESRYQALLVSNEPPDESELDPIASVISDTGRHLES